MQAHLSAWGNHFSYVQRTTDGRVVALWPLNPDLITVRRNEITTELEYEFRHPKIPRVFSRKEVFHIPGFGYNGLVGKSPITLAREAIGLGLAEEEFGARFFGEGTHPSVVIKHPKKLGDGHKNLRESLGSAFSGLGKSHRMMLLEDNMTIDNISIAPEEAQFLSSRKFQIPEICRFWRMPPHMVADLERATFSNIEHQGIEFVVHTLGPWLSLIEAELGHYFLLPEERKEFYFEFMVEKFLRGDIKTRYEAYNIGRNAGWISADEIREKENMSPMANGLGKIYVVGAGVQNLEFIKDKPEPPAPPPALVPKPEEEPATVEKVKALFTSLKLEINGFLKASSDEHFTLFREMWAFIQQSVGSKPSEGLLLLTQGLKDDITAIKADIKDNGFDEKKALQRDNELAKKVDETFTKLEGDRVKRDGKLLAEFQVHREGNVGILAKIKEDNEKDKTTINQAIRGLSESIDTLRANSTISNSEIKLHMDSVNESVSKQITEVTNAQENNGKVLDGIVSEVKEVVKSGGVVAEESLIAMLQKVEALRESDTKDKTVIGKALKQLSNEVGEIRVDKELSDGEKKLQVDALQEEMVKLIGKVSKEQKGYTEEIAKLKVEMGNNHVDVNTIVDGVNGVLASELAKLNKDQGKRIDKLLSDAAEERRLQEERTSEVISRLEGTIKDVREEVVGLKGDQEAHGDEVTQLEGVISILEGQYNELISGRSVVDRNGIISQYTPLIQDAVQMVLNRESIAVKRAVKKFATDKDKLGEWLEDFYRNLPEFIHLKLDRVFSSFLVAMMGAMGDEVVLGRLTQDWIRGYVKKHTEFSLNRLKGVSGNEDPLAVEVVLDEWYANRAMQVAVDETNEMCARVDQYQGEQK